MLSDWFRGPEQALPPPISLGLTKKGLHLSMFRFRGTTLCIGKDADSRDSLPLATGVRD